MVKRKDTIQTEVRNKEYDHADRMDRNDTALNRQAREDAAPMGYDDPNAKKGKEDKGQSTHQGKVHRVADADAWKRSKNKKFVREQALQRLKKHPDDKELRRLAGL